MAKRSLGKAYVQIVPSAHGMKSSLTGIMNKNGSAAGLAGGSAAGRAMVAQLTGLIAAAGIGKALASTLTEGGAMQQALGGVETLFKEHANIIIANSQTAYKTAGMSATEYMETITGFSASLLQGLGGDTEKAAKVADMALTDMSDNANKFGTDMELIKYAYQGFAKQNYTMLDNLKLGYGGTKSEMERLLADAEKLTGVKYDISNLSDVYTAIHVIQEEMGVAGTTAKEATETLSGSFAAMKGAAKTFLGNLALGKDIMPSLKALGDTAYTFLIGNLLPMAGNIVGGLISAIVNTDWGEAAENLVGRFRESIAEAIGIEFTRDTNVTDALFTSINEKIPIAIEKGKEFVGNLVSGILSGLPNVILTAGDIISKFLETVMVNFPKYSEAGASLLIKMLSGIIENIPKIIGAAATVIAKLLSTLYSNAPKMIESGYLLIGKLAAGLIEAVPKLLAKIPGILKDIVNAFKGVDWKKIGKDIIKGIVNGILGAIGYIDDALENVANDMLSGLKKKLGIHSPSVLFEKAIGAMIPPGIARGIMKNAKVTISSIRALGQDTLDAAKTEFSAITAQPTFVGNAKMATGAVHGADIVEAIERFGDKQAAAIERGLANAKWISNNRELARFLTDLGFTRG